MPNFGFTAFYEVRRTLLRRTSRGTNLLRRQKSVGSRWVVGEWKSFRIRRRRCKVKGRTLTNTAGLRTPALLGGDSRCPEKRERVPSTSWLEDLPAATSREVRR